MNNRHWLFCSGDHFIHICVVVDFQNFREGDQSELEKACVIKTEIGFIYVIESHKSNSGLGSKVPVFHCTLINVLLFLGPARGTKHDTHIYRCALSSIMSFLVVCNINCGWLMYFLAFQHKGQAQQQQRSSSPSALAGEDSNTTKQEGNTANWLHWQEAVSCLTDAHEEERCTCGAGISGCGSTGPQATCWNQMIWFFDHNKLLQLTCCWPDPWSPA